MSQENYSLLQMPHSREAEQSVLGSVLIEPECLHDVAVALRPDDFYIEQNREIYETMLAMFNESETVDIVTLLDRLSAYDIFNQTDGREYLLKLAESVPSTANVMRYAAIVADKACLRRMIEAAREVADNCFAPTDNVPALLDASEQRIFDVTQSRIRQSFVPIKEVLVSTYDRLYALKSGQDDQFHGVKTGFYDVDSMIVEMNKSDLVFLAARPGVGKTSFALNVARNVAEEEKKSVAIFSLEMSKEQLTERLLSCEAEIEGKMLRTARFPDSDWEKLAKASLALSSCDIDIDDTPGITITEMKAKLRRKKNLGLVVIDYLQLMQGSRRTDNRVQEISEITRSMKIMAKDLMVPVLVLSQLSRGPEQRQSKRPMLSDLRESGSIEQDADMVLFLYRDDYYDKDTENKNICSVIVAKNRHGETGEAELTWLGQYSRFYNREHDHDDDAY